MPINWKIAIALLAAAAPAAAEMPEFYRKVDRVFWVVEDLDRTVAGWRKLGMIETGAAGPQARDGSRWLSARLGDTAIDFVRPESGSEFRRFQQERGQGVFALVHRVPTEQAFDAEVARMKALGVGILATGRVDDADAHYVLFDTAKDGKYVLGLVFAPAGEYTGALAVPPARGGAKRVSQYAFVVRDMQAVSRYWARLGLPAMTFTHPPIWDQRYHGGPGDFDALLGWQKHGAVEYEWIQPTKGPTTYMDHMAKYGEGIHHIAFAVPDIERAEKEWTTAGFPTVQSGAWGERDQPGYGRYAYQDVHAIGGIDVELLWNFRK